MDFAVVAGVAAEQDLDVFFFDIVQVEREGGIHRLCYAIGRFLEVDEQGVVLERNLVLEILDPLGNRIQVVVLDIEQVVLLVEVDVRLVFEEMDQRVALQVTGEGLGRIVAEQAVWGFEDDGQTTETTEGFLDGTVVGGGSFL